ncbi:FtsK/SpoIIIE domain-containing protein [Mammaliicoccus sciuri]|uniref:FtsK/SpoIIIE domain-containing protein n=1 Tax=Mammaliicoccus sciuri TaxID=1296 RepID=UPI002DB556F5|nr:FtsK/SpoIIIE domain-containing protein [Mammaliicoccus sciuri]MEB8073972.1 FtsK/SpoIIIE domain-containing protein [Mammaliicoccus sciuri]
MKKILYFFKNKKPIVSMYDKDLYFLKIPKYIKFFKLIILYLILGVFIISFMVDNIIFTFFLWIIGVISIVKYFKLIKFIKNKYNEKYALNHEILKFIINNKLYSEDSNGIVTSSRFSYKLADNVIIIYALMSGNYFDNKLRDLGVQLQGLMDLPITEKIIRHNCTEYHFNINKPQRLEVTTQKVEYNNSNEINIGYGVTYNPAKSPHILISGGTGSGKSMLMSYLLIELLKKNSTIFLCDPKNSDLGSLSNYLGQKNVGTTPNNIARVIREAVEEMKRRYAYMNEHFIYGSNFETHKFKPVWILFDEIGAFQAYGTDKKSKEVVNEVMDGIKQIILLGRQAGCFILIAGQQINANNLSTELRDNFSLRISLGFNSSEGLRMMFGSATPDVTIPIEVKGAGLLYLHGSGKEQAQYYESPYIDEQFNFIEELKKYIPEKSKE